MSGRSEGGGAGEKETAPPPIEVGVDRASVPAGDPNAIADARDAPPAPAAASAEDNRAAARMPTRLDAVTYVAQDPSAAARACERRDSSSRGAPASTRRHSRRRGEVQSTPTMNRLHTRVCVKSRCIVRVCDGPTTEDLA